MYCEIFKISKYQSFKETPVKEDVFWENQIKRVKFYPVQPNKKKLIHFR